MSVKLLLRWLFHLFWIGGCALSMLWQTDMLTSHATPSGWLLGFVFGATVFGYNFAAPRRRRQMAWGMGLFAGFCFFHLNLSQQISTVVPMLIWLMYYDMHRPPRAGLRIHPGLKPVAIALVWAWVTVLLPVPPSAWTGVGVLFVGRTAFIFALALAYDLCDQPSDLRHGLNTLVLQLGPHRSFRLINAALFLAAVCSLLNLFLHRYSPMATLALIISLLISAWSIRRIVPRLEWNDWRKVGIDGLMIIQLVLVWLAGIYDLYGR